MEPKEFAERILQEHAARRQAAGRWEWSDDPAWSELVALAAVASRWDVTADQFEAKLRRLCRTPTGAARPAAQRLLARWRQQQEAEAAGLPTVLVVEDEPEIMNLYRDLLGDAYRLIEAETWADGLTAAFDACPDAIVLDLMLPGGHGARMLAELNGSPTTARIPVIIVSAYTGGLREKDRQHAARVIQKPFRPIELLDAVAAAIHDASSRRR